MAKETKTRAELQAIFKAELGKLGMSENDKPSIEPASNNSRFTWSVFQAGAVKGDAVAAETAVEAVGKALQDRYDLSDEP